MDGTTRKISKIIEPQAVVEGAGVRLKRSIGTHTLDYLDPFLLLDHFQSKNPADYQAGFPLHPHRGIETVTYLLAARCGTETQWGMPAKSGRATCSG